MTLPANIPEEYAPPAPMLPHADADEDGDQGTDPDPGAQRAAQVRDIVRLMSQAELPGAVRARLVAAFSSAGPRLP